MFQQYRAAARRIRQPVDSSQAAESYFCSQHVAYRAQMALALYIRQEYLEAELYAVPAVYFLSCTERAESGVHRVRRCQGCQDARTLAESVFQKVVRSKRQATAQRPSEATPDPTQSPHESKSDVATQATDWRRSVPRKHKFSWRRRRQ
jgi:hypothetical protein